MTVAQFGIKEEWSGLSNNERPEDVPYGTTYFRTDDGETETYTADGWINQDGGEARVPGSRIVKVPFTFETPGLLTGATVYTPLPTEIITAILVSVTAAFDGTTPAATIYIDGEDYTSLNFISLVALGTPDSVADQGGDYTKPVGYTSSGLVVYGGTAPIKLIVDDGAAGDPSPITQGEGAVYIFTTVPAVL